MVKKWKGKDWYSISLPEEYGAKFTTQTPTTDSKTIAGRNLEIGVNEFMNDPRKMHMKLKVILHNPDGKSVKSTFNGFECSREHLLRMVRKRNQKVEAIFNASTKDEWLLRFTALAILNGNTNATVKKRMREFIQKRVEEFSKKFNVNDLVKRIISSELQLKIKKEGSKIYPVRFCEIAKIKVKKSPVHIEIESKKKTPKKEQKEEKPEKTEKPAKEAKKKEEPKKPKKE